MVRLNWWHSFVAVISLFSCVIWHVPVHAAVAPVLSSLGRIDEGLLAAGRLDVDKFGNLYVADGQQKKVLKYDQYGRLVRTYSGFPVYAQGLAVTPDGTKLYVAGKTVVTIVDGDSGAVTGRLHSDEHPTGEGEFSYVNEIDLDADDYIFVADMGTATVHIYDSGGSLYTPFTNGAKSFGGIGTAAYPAGTLGHGQFRSIWAMTVDPAAGEVYVADNQEYGSRRSLYAPQIQVFDLAGGYKRSIVQNSFYSSALVTPPLAMFSGFAFDDVGRGYFLDSTWDNIRIQALPSTVLAQFGTQGYDIGQLNAPYDIVFDPFTKRLFVSADGGRIEIFGLDGVANPVPPVTNVAPGSPVLIGPGGGGEVVVNPPIFTMQNAVDGDDDTLTYAVKVLFEGQEVAGVSGVAAGVGNTLAPLTQMLQENAFYSWSAQASDGQTTSIWATEETFCLNALQEAPTAPLLLQPAAIPTVLDGGARFSWEVSVDPDPYDTFEYQLQVAADAMFRDPVLDVTVGNATSVVLGELAGYADLVEGQTYYWQVKAVDNHGLESLGGEIRSFVYDTTVLTVAANMPGARVYLGGSLAYAGRYVGDAPLELRDLAAATLSVVVERAGFEPWVAQAVVADRGNVDLYAALVPAIAPLDLKARPLSVNGSKLVRGADVAPTVVDFDNDGFVDLLTGEAAGILTLYRGQASEQPPAFGAGEALAVTVPAGSAPVVVDWNNDGKKDLLVGVAVGTVQLYLNRGTEVAPLFQDWEYLSVAGEPITVGSSAVPAVFDWDGDGDKDLLIGAGAGSVTVFRNVGSDADPELAAGEWLLPALSGNAAPFVVDWNADGREDLLVATNQHLYLCLGQADGSFLAANVLTVSDDLVGKNGNAGNGSRYVGDRLRVFAFDADGMKGKDLLLGNAAGEVRLARSNGKEFVPAFYAALLEKVAQVRDAVPEGSVSVVQALDVMAAALADGNLSAARQQCDLLQVQMAGMPAVETLLAELTSLLN